MTGYRLSRLAESDLEEVADYIGARNPAAAVRQLEMLLDKFAVLGRSPSLGELRKDLPGHPRVFAAGAYVIVYRPTAEGIEVVRVIHSARDLESLLRR